MGHFIPHPDIGVPEKGVLQIPGKLYYKNNYNKIFRDIELRKFQDIGKLIGGTAYKHLVETDLFFLVYFVMNMRGGKNNPYGTNRPFVVKMCQVVENGPKNKTLDIWAREHLKMLPLNEPVPTPDGWTAHGDLVPGDIVFAPDGKTTTVIAKNEVVSDGKCYEIEFDDGCRIRAGEEHLWEVERRTRKRIPGVHNKPGPKRLYRESVIMKTSEIFACDHISNERLAVKVAQPLELPEKDFLIAPYALGAWLGDGTSTNGAITCGDPELFDVIADCGYVVGHNMTPARNSEYRTIKGLMPQLRKLGLLKNKHIPIEYFRGSVSQRLELLQGLMDTDGSCDTRGTATFGNTNKKLAEGAWELAGALGLKPSFRIHYTTYKNEPYRFYNVSFQAYEDFPPFCIERKVFRCKEGSRPNSRRYIVSCKAIPSEPMSCVQVDRADGMYLVGKNYLPTHNSSIITVAETIQECLKDPEEPNAIFSFNRPVAKKFLGEIKRHFENSLLLKTCYPDVLYDNPFRDSPLWSLDEGLILQRKTNRKEPTLSGWGLIEGMPTGLHFSRRVYDDIVTEDIGGSPDQMEKVKQKFDSSQNLGTDGGTHRVVGTFYHHSDPLIYIRGKKDVNDKSMYLLRLYPATDDGTRNGSPVFLSQSRLDELKGDRTFSCQQLLDPTPTGEQELNSALLKDIDVKDIPKNLYKFLLIDPAGDNNTGKGDPWGIVCVGVEPTTDDIGACNIYILDAYAEVMGRSQAIEEVVRMYIRNGYILKVGVEQVGMSSIEVHVADQLYNVGRTVSIDSGSLVLLKPARRNKVQRITGALAWPLNNGKVYISSAVPYKYRELIKLEMDRLGYWHEDIIDALSYVYDILKDFHFAALNSDAFDDDEYSRPVDRTGMNRTCGY